MKIIWFICVTYLLRIYLMLCLSSKNMFLTHYFSPSSSGPHSFRLQFILISLTQFQMDEFKIYAFDVGVVKHLQFGINCVLIWINFEAHVDVAGSFKKFTHLIASKTTLSSVFIYVGCCRSFQYLTFNRVDSNQPLIEDCGWRKGKKSRKTWMVFQGWP